MYPDTLWILSTVVASPQRELLVIMRGRARRWFGICDGRSAWPPLAGVVDQANRLPPRPYQSRLSCERRCITAVEVRLRFTTLSPSPICDLRCRRSPAAWLS